jgi:hypothetical protein
MNKDEISDIWETVYWETLDELRKDLQDDLQNYKSSIDEELKEYTWRDVYYIRKKDIEEALITYKNNMNSKLEENAMPKENHRIIISGSRDGVLEKDVHSVIDELIKEYGKNITIITGGARGVETIADTYAEKRGLRTEVFLADWKKYHNGAGMVRNRQMLNQNPSRVICIYSGKRTAGTANMAKIARERSVDVREYGLTEDK